MTQHELTALSTTLSYIAKSVSDLREDIKTVRTGQTELGHKFVALERQVNGHVISPTKLRNEVAKLRARCATQGSEIKRLNKALNNQFP